MLGIVKTMNVMNLLKVILAMAFAAPLVRCAYQRYVSGGLAFLSSALEASRKRSVERKEAEEREHNAKMFNMTKDFDAAS